MEESSQQILVPIDGLPMAKNCSVSRFREATGYRAKEGDVFVCSYHKSGTTWLQYMVWELGNPGADPPYVHEMMLDFAPRIEQMGVRVKEDGVRRHFKTHLPFSYAPYSEKAKYLHVTRNPWDVCISYFNMLKQMPQFYGFKDGTFDEFFADFIKGHNDSGSFFDHLAGWHAQRDKRNILFLRYEQLKQDHRGSLVQIAKFLGPPYSDAASDPAMVEKILHLTSFDYMKNLPFVLPSSFEVIKRTGVINVGKRLELVDTGDYKRVDFFKVGKVGYGKEIYTDSQKEIMNQTIREKLSAFPDLVQEFVL